MARVAIGLAVYNGEQYLATAIESILAQTFTDFELLISDNASTDRTEEICRRYAEQDSRIRYFRRPQNIGSVPNYNDTVRMTKSPYFKFAAHDDALAPTFLETCVAALDADPSVVLAAPATSFIDKTGAALPYSPERGGWIDRDGNVYLAEKNEGLGSDNPVDRFGAILLHTKICVEVFGLIRRSALERCYPQGAFLGGDKVLIAELSLQGRFWKGTEPLFYRRCHSEQFSAKANIRETAGVSRAEWYAGPSASRLAHHLYSEKIVLLAAYCRAMMTVGHLTYVQRLGCLATVFRRAVSRRVWNMLTSPLLLRQ